jgi:type IV secretory pathway VirB4 component
MKKPASVQETIRYRRMMEDGICEIVPGFYSKTIKFEDITYQLLDRDGKIAVFARYCELLNYFDSSIHVQISVVNRNIDRVDFRNNMFLKFREDNLNDAREEYNRMLSNKISESQSNMIREKYITFTVKAQDYFAAQQILYRVENDIYNNFKTLGSNSYVLNGRERLSLMYHFFHGSDYFNFDYDYLLKFDLSTKDFVSPDSFNFSNKSYYEMGSRYGKTLFLKDMPPDLSDKLITELSDININLRITIHFDSVEQDKAFDLVKQKIAFMEQQKIDEQRKALNKGYDLAMIPWELRHSLDEAQGLLDDLQNKNQRIFKFTCLVHVSADNLEDLDDYVYQVKSIARKNNCKLGDLDYLQEEAMNSSLPIGVNLVEIYRTLTTAAVAIFVPFTTQELFQPGGMYYGINTISRNLIFFDRKSLKNANGFILGTPGSGKSFAAKREMLNVLLNSDDEVMVIDPEREYSAMAGGLNGQVIFVSAASKNNINPLDVSTEYADTDDPLSLKSEFVLSLCELIIGGSNGLGSVEKTIIDRVTKLTYKEYFRRPKSTPMPTLLDFYNILTQQEEMEAEELSLGLELYITGSLNVFSKPTNIDLRNRFVVFDIKDLGKQLKTFGMLVVLDQIWNRITINRAIGRRTWIYIDEIYLLFQNEYSANYLFELYKRARKWGGVPTGITQNVEDLLISDLARRMLSNSEFILMLNQASSDRTELEKLLNMSSRQANYVTNVGAGQGLLFSGTATIPFIDKFPTNSKLYQMMTTKLEETSSSKTDKNITKNKSDNNNSGDYKSNGENINSDIEDHQITDNKISKQNKNKNINLSESSEIENRNIDYTDYIDKEDRDQSDLNADNNNINQNFETIENKKINDDLNQDQSNSMLKQQNKNNNDNNLEPQDQENNQENKDQPNKENNQENNAEQNNNLEPQDQENNQENKENTSSDESDTNKKN